MEGQRSTALSEQGQQQAHQLARSLVRAENTAGNAAGAAAPNSPDTADTQPSTASHSQTIYGQTIPTHLYSSPLLRARQTAHALHQALQQVGYERPIQPSERLQEIHPGIFQGLTWQAATEHYPALCDRLMTSLAWQPVPQAETPTQARQRATDWLNTILSRHQPGETIWAVSHAGLMTHLVSAILGSDRTWSVPIHHTAIFEFWLASNHWESLTHDRFNPEYWLLKRFNNIQHLQ